MVPPEYENRLMPEEIAYRRPGNSPETRGWNRHFERLVNEYGAAVEDGDEGWIANTVDEVRKILGDSVMGECGLRTLARRALWRSHQHRCQTGCGK